MRHRGTIELLSLVFAVGMGNREGFCSLFFGGELGFKDVWRMGVML